ncbi:MAG TPA: AI-2E family transporter [Methylophilaceae bacterium]|nr:AI-2E family transporter [Methylophilaceae bacterium]
MASKQENVLPDFRWILLFAGCLVLIYLLRSILAPFLFAAVLAYICSPLVDTISRLAAHRFNAGLMRTIGTVLVMLLLTCVLVVLVLVIVPLLHKEILLVAERTPAYLDNLRIRLDPWLSQNFGITLALDIEQLKTLAMEHWRTATNYLGPLLLTVGNRGLAFIGWIINLLLVPVVLFFLLRDWHHLIAQISELLPRRWYGKVAQIAHEIDLVLAEFLRGQLSVMLLMSIFYATGLWLAGLELALPIGLIAGMLGFIPYVGAAIAIFLALLSAALQFPEWSQLIPIFVVFGLGQLVESMLLTPWLVGDRIGLHPVAVIFALLAGGQLFGFTGVLLALPVSAAIAVGLRHARQGYLASDTYLK